ncbi:unnamed protein product [Closterium sp. Naga37s-1]|nr:unnamed protein product [Closterium sp. Naga37s-1]
MAFLQQSLENVACRFPGLTSDPFQAPRSDVDLALPADPLLSSPQFTDDSSMQDSATAAVLAAASAMQQESLLRRQRMAASLCSAGFPFSSALASSPLSWQSRLSNPLLNSSFLSSTIDPLGPSAAQMQLLESMVAATSPTGNATLLNSSLLNSSLPNSFLTHFTPSAKRAAPDASASDGKTQRPRKRGRPSYKDRAAAAAAAAAEAEAKKAAARAALRESAFGSAGADSDRVTSLGGTAPSANTSAPQRKMQRILPRAVPMRAPLVPGLTQVPDSAALMAALLPQATSDFSVALQAALEQARCRAALAEAFAASSAVGPSLEQRAQLWMARLTAAGATGGLPSAAPAAVDAALADLSPNNVSVSEAKLAAAAAGLLAAEGGDPKDALFSKLPASRVDESALVGAASRLVSASDAKELSPPETGAAGTGGSSVTDVAANQSVGGASAAAAATPLPAGVLAIDWMFGNGPSDTKDSRFLLPETAADLEEHGDETAPSPHTQSIGQAAAEKSAAGAAGAAGSSKGPSPTSTTFFRRQPADSTSSPPAVVVAAAFELLAKNMAPPPPAPRSFASLPAATASAAVVGRSVSDEPSSVVAVPMPQMLRRVSSHATAGTVGAAGAAKGDDMRSVMMMVDEELRSLRQAGARGAAVAAGSQVQEKGFTNSSAAASAYCIPVPAYLAVPTAAEDTTGNGASRKLESNAPMDLMPIASDCPVLNQASLDLTLKFCDAFAAITPPHCVLTAFAPTLTPVQVTRLLLARSSSRRAPHREQQWQADGRGAASAFSSCLKPLAAADNAWWCRHELKSSAAGRLRRHAMPAAHAASTASCSHAIS